MSADRRRHDDEHEEHENHERWLVSYADMLTLLFALFVVLYAISSLNKSKLEAFQSSFKNEKAKGQPAITQPNPQPDPVKPTKGHPVTRAELEGLKKDIEGALAKAHLQNAAKLDIDERGLSVNLTDGVLYRSGDAVLLPEGVRVLDVIAPELTGIDNNIYVEGHTDNVPISNSRYPDNWELSSARANSVVRFFLGKYHVDPERMAASGFADTRPKVANDSPEHRALNRRVVILIEAPNDPSKSGAPPPEAG